VAEDADTEGVKGSLSNTSKLRFALAPSKDRWNESKVFVTSTAGSRMPHYAGADTWLNIEDANTGRGRSVALTDTEVDALIMALLLVRKDLDERTKKRENQKTKGE